MPAIDLQGCEIRKVVWHNYTAGLRERERVGTSCIIMLGGLILNSQPAIRKCGRHR